MKNIINIATTIFLFIFSIIYTKKAIIFLQNNDPLIKEIKNQENNYYLKPIDAIITKNYMIPGISGKTININESYKKMKKLNSFNKSLIVYEDILPNKTINNNYDKVILKGNPKLKHLSIIVNTNNNYQTINSYMKNNNLYLDIYSNQNIDISNTNFQNIVTDSYYYFTDYCLYNNQEIDNNCYQNNKYTIKVSNIKSLQDVKDNLSNGVIFLYNNKQLDNLNIIIKYLRNNNYQIKTIDKLINEKE